jgi:hypothetical protein
VSEGSQEEIDELFSQLDRICKQGNFEKALFVADRIQDLSRKCWGENHRNYANNLSLLAKVYLDIHEANSE